MLHRDQVLVVDVEASCWRGHPPPGEQIEIIEIGFCLLRLDPLCLEPAHSILIKPQRSHISPFCTQLTSITPELAAQGRLFNEACTLLLRNYVTQSVLWGSWGRFDREIFKRQCQSFAVEYPFSPRHVDLRRLFARAMQQPGRKARQMGLLRALDSLGLTFEGTSHRGQDDAWNTARVLQALIAAKGVDVLKDYW
jgi:inhibitor of KinA sporulation pathway (predicted exonuclease)